MTLYNLHCDRCGGVKTHEKTWDGKEYVQSRMHNGTEVYCRSCERGNSKGDLDGATDIWAKYTVAGGVGLTIYPEDIPEDETLEEHIERRLKEDSLGRIAADIADGIRESAVEYAGHETEDE